MSSLTRHSKPEVGRIVGRLQEVMKRPVVEIARHEHADVISSLQLRRRMRRTKFRGVARRTRRDVIGWDSPRGRAVVERALELRMCDDVHVT